MYRLAFAFCILAIPTLAQTEDAQPTTTALNLTASTEPSGSTTGTPTPVFSNSQPSTQYSQSTTTTSVLTHFSMPSRTASSSTFSSFHPLQSAPYPDDSVGKYGPLHISGANSNTSGLYQSLVALAVLFSFTALLMLKV
ncbi:hypothetical protein BJV82DRAFT_615278 [Fennellomyces sp. T-0311]|nr:hypothetical protein BJV82DRAFT_615278 [Fennellomyces sp. T-0311]